MSSSSERSSHYTAALRQAMLAYSSALAGTASHGDDILCTAAGLIYLAIRDVFTSGWGKEASTWLWLGADVIQNMPRANAIQIATQRWFARAVWLWGKGVAVCGMPMAESRLRACFTNSELQRIRDESPLASLELDEDQRTFSRDSLI